MRRVLSAVLLSSVLAVPTLAHADDAAIGEAQARFKEGLTLADKGKLDEARLKFLQAYAVVHAASVAYNLAITEEKTGHTIEAIAHYRAFLVSGVNDTRVTDAMRTRAKASIAELSKKVGQIAVDVPADTKVTIDGAPVDSVGEPVAVSEGRHTVEGTHAGRVKSVAVEARIGEVTKASLTFAEEPAPATPAMTTTTTEPPAEPPPQRRWTTARIATVGGLGAGAVAGVVLAVVFHGKASDKVDESRALLNGGSCIGMSNTTCSTAATLRDDRDSADTATTVSVIAAGALGAGAVAAALFWPKSRSTSGRIVPEVSPGYGGMKLVGRF